MRFEGTLHKMWNWTPKIKDLWYQVGIDNYILRFEVSVQYFLWVEKTKAFSNFVRELKSHFDTESFMRPQHVINILLVIIHVNHIFFIPWLLDLEIVSGNKRWKHIFHICNCINLVFERIYRCLCSWIAFFISEFSSELFSPFDPLMLICVYGSCINSFSNDIFEVLLENLWMGSFSGKHFLLTLPFRFNLE